METFSVIWQKIKSFWPFEYQWIAIDPDHTELKQVSKTNVSLGVTINYKIYVQDLCVTDWCDENCKGRVKYHFLRDREKVRAITKLFGQKSEPRVGIVLIRFSNKKEAALFRLTFNHVAAL